MARDSTEPTVGEVSFHVEVLPEDEGGFTLWLRELSVGGSGATLKDARRELLSAVRSYVRNYLAEFDSYRHLPEMVRQEPYALRLSLAKDDGDLAAMLFGSRSSADGAA